MSTYFVLRHHWVYSVQELLHYDDDGRGHSSWVLRHGEGVDGACMFKWCTSK